MRLLLTLLLLYISAVDGTSQSLLYNAEFDERTNSDLIPGWQHYRLAGGRSGIAAQEGQGGTDALRIASPFPDRGSGGAYQTVVRQPGQFQRYRISARVRIEGVSGEGASVYVYGSTGMEEGNYAWSDALVGDQGWTTLELFYAAEEAMDSLTVGLLLRGEGTVWFDDVELIEAEVPTTPISTRAVAYVDEFFAKVSARALNHEQIDWTKLRQLTLSYAAGAQTEADVHSTLLVVLRKINKHSLMTVPLPEQVVGNGDRIPNIRYAEGRRINDRIAYLSVPDVSGPPSVTVPFADSLQALIRTLDTEETEGWIVDLREDGGGNCWPMLVGLGPLFTGDTLGYFQQRDGSQRESWSYADGRAFMDSYVQLALSGPAYTLQHDRPRVAVLTGPQTSSSGEVVTVAFREQPNARSFGQPTYGNSTTNADILLSDGAIVHLTVSVYADRTGQTYGEAIVPEVVTDDAMAAAEEWLLEPPQCNDHLTTYGTAFVDLATTDFTFLDGPLDSIDLVGYGEDTHGTAEFTQLAGELFFYLVREKGFRSLIIEDSFGAARKMDRFVQGEIDEVRDVLYDGNWRYYTTQFVELLTKLRDYNRQHPDDPVHLYGPEMQYVNTDAEFLQAYLREQGAAIDLSPMLEATTIWNDRTESQVATDAALIARADSLLSAGRQTWRMADSTAFDYALQHLTVIQQYLTAHQQTTWEPKHEIREAGMFENIEWIRAHSPQGKAMYWAHNGHVYYGVVNGDVVATGRRLRSRYGDRYYAIGTDFGTGSVLAHAADAEETGWGLAERTMPQLDTTTLTACLDGWGNPNYFVDLRAARRDPALRDYMQQEFRSMAGAGAQVRSEPVEVDRYLQRFDGLVYLRASSPVVELGER